MAPHECSRPIIDVPSKAPEKTNTTDDRSSLTFPMRSGLERFVLDVLVDVGPMLPGERRGEIELVQLLILHEFVDHVVDCDANIFLDVYVGFCSAGHVGARV